MVNRSVIWFHNKKALFYFLTYSCMCANVWGSQPTHSHSICWFGIIPREPPGSILISSECQYTFDSPHWNLLLFPWSYSPITWRFSLSLSLSLSLVKWVKSLSPVWLFATPWTVAYQGPHPWDFPGKSTGVGCHFLLQGIFLTQGSNPGLLHCRQMLYSLSHQGGPISLLRNNC